MPTRDWNASSYDTISTPQQQWGAEVLGRLALTGGETVLDLGCGTGRVTEMVLARLPHGRVVAVDGSESMCASARERLDPARVSVVCADLLELELPERCDAAISTATFHWVFDHDALFARVRRTLRDGAQFVAQCGGAGNIERTRALGARLAASDPFAPYTGAIGELWNYATPAQTRERLERAGFAVSRCWLERKPTTPPRPREFLATVIFAPYVERLPPALRDRFLDSALAELGEPLELDYVRLNWDATAA
ncbi:MAG TPA: methyltransferase domain-containing protein [Solirubrobacteraceae bacterium]|nr:methyltransferase domain-containing protein [Solirubrobacteraceae bacterium]